MTKFLPVLLFLTCLVTPQVHAFGIVCDGDDVRTGTTEEMTAEHENVKSTDASRTARVCTLIAKHAQDTDTKESDSIGLLDQFSNLMLDLTR